MEKIIEKVENLKKIIDKEYGHKIKEANNLIAKDKELIKLLEEYSKNPNDEIKNKILKNKLFQKYKEGETEINIVILAINSKLKELTNNKRCTL